jgi:transcriptional adapter 2-alpha
MLADSRKFTIGKIRKGSFPIAIDQGIQFGSKIEIDKTATLMSGRGQLRNTPPVPKRQKDQSDRRCCTCDAHLWHCPYVKCLRCPDLNQCLECFATAATCEGHSTDHPFVILDYIPEPLTREDWTSEQEALLLIGIRIYGIGNWHEVEKVIQSKTALECETHYFQTYIECQTAPLPLPKILPPLEKPPDLPYDTTPRDSRPKISDDYHLRQQGKIESTTPGEFAGWMPYRQEFEIEYLNEAEEIVSSLTFSETDETEESLCFKLQQLVEYNEVLVERQTRQRFALDWGLLDREVKDFGGETTEEIEMEQVFMPLAQIIPRPVLLEFINELRAEMRSQADLNILANWKRNGIATHDEGFLFNQLQALISSATLTEAQVEEWNQKIISLLNSTEFRATLYRGIMSPEENELTRRLKIAPAMYLKVKDLLIREFMRRGELTTEVVEHIAQDSRHIVFPIYQMLLRSGIFLVSEDLVTQSAALESARNAAMEERERVEAQRKLHEDENEQQLAQEEERMRMYRHHHRHGSSPSASDKGAADTSE